MYLKSIFILLFILLVVQISFAQITPKKGGSTISQQQQQISYFNDCVTSTAQIDLNINNVRARLKLAGDMWWDNDNAGYIVPNVEPGEEAVAAIFAGALWMGGFDEGGNLKLAAQTYGAKNNKSDYWPGPLDDQGSTNAENCNNWDQFFVVHKTSVDQLKVNWTKALSQNRTELNPDEIPEEIKGWPALGNPFFEDIHGFALPNGNNGYNGLAEFWDEGGIAGIYEPQFGDYPILGLRGCDLNTPSIPDQMIFSIINDAGGIHKDSQGEPLLMEIHNTAFAFKTTDEINDMTFYKYRLVNRALEDLDSTHIGIWMANSLGCPYDDLIGCDTTRGLAYTYNKDELDGIHNCDDCPGNSTYCMDIPVIGVDFLRGPINEFGKELKMSSFTYYDTGQTMQSLATLPPNQPSHYYNYLSGYWRDGTPVNHGGSGYTPSPQEEVKYVFPSPPNDPDGWNMCNAYLGFGYYQTIQGTGPFTLKPGAINELTTGVIWVPSIKYPCPDLSRFFAADDKAQDLFDHCFEELLTDVLEPIVFDPISIFPNPYSLSSGGLLNIEGLPNNSMVSIFDINGRLLKRYSGENQLQLDLRKDLDQVNTGTYLLQVQGKDQKIKAYKLLLME